MDLIWLIPLLPGLGAALNGIVGIRYFGKRATAVLACSTMAVALALSVVAFGQLLGSAEREHLVTVTSWIPAIRLETAEGMGSFEVPWAFRLDPLSALMILVVTGIGFLIHVYSVAYMDHEPPGSYARFFCYLNLFCFFMLMLVLGSNFLVMFVGWEGVGLCSYLLIGYWYRRKTASDAGKKAFIVNRIGDWGFILGVFLVYFTFGTLDFRAVADAAAAMPAETPEAGFGVLSLIGLLLFIGAIGKSAQIPLYVWLPDAMEGPTPVSALIHAATMVTAGVYMVGRNALLYSQAPMVMQIVAIIGVATALLAASIGLVQNDIKRVLAYSTVSQLGYMFLAMGVGAFAAGAFHLMTHAFFKALLFLGSGSVIHAMADEQDMRTMGALKLYMPVTCATMVVGTLAIAGVPPLSGFFSKDEILYRAFLRNPFIWAIAAVTAGMTAFYMWRLIALTFLGPYRGRAWPLGHGHPTTWDHQDHEPPLASGLVDAGHGGRGVWHGPHEAPRLMTVPLMVLAVGAIVAGLVGIPAALGGNNVIEHFLEPSFTAGHAPSPAASAAWPEASAAQAVPSPEAGPRAAESAARFGVMAAEAARVAEAGLAQPGAGEGAAEHAEGGAHLSRGAELGLMLLSVVIGLAGIALAHHFYVRRPEISERLAQNWAGAHRVLTNKYYVDELYDATAVRGTMGSARGMWVFDRAVVDGAVNGTGWATIAGSWISHIIDKYVVDGLINLIALVTGEASYSFRRVQTGLIQNYALATLLGVFAFVSLYLLARYVGLR